MRLTGDFFQVSQERVFVFRRIIRAGIVVRDAPEHFAVRLGHRQRLVEARRRRRRPRVRVDERRTRIASVGTPADRHRALAEVVRVGENILVRPVSVGPRRVAVGPRHGRVQRGPEQRVGDETRADAADVFDRTRAEAETEIRDVAVVEATELVAEAEACEAIQRPG